MSSAEKLERLYRCLYDRYGWAGWWPAEDDFEIIVGAILTQNTAWKNVEKAIDGLKREGLLSPKKLFEADISTIAKIIKPSGYYNIKSRRLKNFLEFLFHEYGGDLSRMFDEEMMRLREKLLLVKGLGYETVDSILLYAGRKPIFVIDRYTVRILARHGLLPEETDYHYAQEFFMSNLPADVNLFNNFHALMVKVGNLYCKREPACSECPLKEFE